jgi:lipoate-protein ligase A
MAGRASVLHRRPWPESPVPSVWFLAADAPALVLGSTQAPVVVEDRAFEVVRRHSGGGAVVLRPGSVLWVDVVVPSADPLWNADVGRAFWWLGETWVEALGAAGVEGARWHEGPLVRSPWSDRVCFAGLGPGEVTLEGRKVVGMSQRRRRDAALFQCAALLEWDGAEISRLLRLGRDAETELAGVAAGLGVDGERLARAFLQALVRR